MCTWKTDYFTPNQLVQLSKFNIIGHELYVYFNRCLWFSILDIMCVPVCVCLPVHEVIKVRGSCWDVFLNCFPFDVFEAGFLTKLEFYVLTRLARQWWALGSTHLLWPPSAGNHDNVQQHLTFHVSTDDSNSSAHAFSVKLYHWAVSPTLILAGKKNFLFK